MTPKRRTRNPTRNPTAGRNPDPGGRPEPEPQPAGNPEPNALDNEGGEDDASQKQNIEAPTCHGVSP